MITSNSPFRRPVVTNHTEICITNLGCQTEPHDLLTYFEQFGLIKHYNFTHPNASSGPVFIIYEDRTSVDRCMASRPHRIDGRHVYVKRGFPYSAEHPREHLESVRDLMIVLDSNEHDEELLQDLRTYFSSYGLLYACKYCHESSFDYVLVEFADHDQVDRIILDKPHYLHQRLLNVMKCSSSNKRAMYRKLSASHSADDSSSTIRDAIDMPDDDESFQFEQNESPALFNQSSRRLSDLELETEVNRLQRMLKQINEDFVNQRKQLEEDCCQELKQLNVNADRTHRLQQDLEKDYAELVMECQSLKDENEALADRYLMAELENFEITSHYEQILAEEQAKVAHYESIYTNKLRLLHADDSSLLLSSRRPSSSTTPSPPAIPDDD